jgi:hypothetical protein
VIYKGRGRGPAKHPRCIACFPKSVAGQVVPLSRGVSIVLCADHRDPAFLHSRGGRDFLAATGALFRGLGLSGRRWQEALSTFLDDVRATRGPTPRRRPGSYAWPGVRRRAEEVWNAGGSFEDGMRAVYTHVEPITTGFSLPSLSTVRRWWRQKRWFLARPVREARRAKASIEPLEDRVPMLHVRPPYRPVPLPASRSP